MKPYDFARKYLKRWKPLLIRLDQHFKPEPHEQYKRAQELIQSAENMVDLGCGPSPHPQATVGVDLFIEPSQRSDGRGDSINIDSLKDRGVTFIQSSIDSTPFIDKEFDVSYSHHVIEHVEDPIKACKEIQRISRRGVIICPNACAEYIFGRIYHNWFIFQRDNTLVFIEKKGEENQPFGKNEYENPFDIALNDNYWYWKPILIPFLRKKLRYYWYSHSPILEIVFTWDEYFNVVVIDTTGNVKSYRPRD